MSNTESLQPYAFSASPDNDKRVLNYLMEYKIMSLTQNRSFPLRLTKNEEGEDADTAAGSSKISSKAINSHLKDLVLLGHGSFENKVKIIEDFMIAFPDCSKKSIELRIKELFVKEKRN